MKKLSICLFVFLSILPVAAYNEDLEEFTVFEDDLKETAAGTVVGEKAETLRQKSGETAAWDDDLEEFEVGEEDIGTAWNVAMVEPMATPEKNLAKQVFNVRNIRMIGSGLSSVAVPAVNFSISDIKFSDFNIKVNTPAVRTSSGVIYRTVYRNKPILVHRRVVHHKPHRPRFGPLRPHLRRPIHGHRGRPSVIRKGHRPRPVRPAPGRRRKR